MHQLDLVLTLAAGLGAALVFGYVTHRLGLSPIVGYLIAGIALGPATPGFVADRELAQEMAEIGVVLLMFGVGLQFHVSELLAVRRIAIPGALFQSLVATVLGALVLTSTGAGLSAGVVYGLAISVASTVVLVRVLSDNGDLHTPVGHIAVGWLIMEDLLTVFVVVLLPLLTAGSGNGSLEGLAQGFLWAVLKIGVLVGVVALVGDRVIPWVLRRVALTRSRELFTLAILAVALGIAVGSALVFDVSTALGAFLAGIIVGRSEFSLRAASEALPMRDAFAVLFFVSVGMLFDPYALVESPTLVALTLLIILVGKPLAAFMISAALGYPSRVALGVAAALGQIGEFTFIVAVVGNQLGLLSQDATNAMVAASIVSISVNPLAYRTVDPLNRRLAATPWATRLVSGRRGTGVQAGGVQQDVPLPSQYRAIIVGYGPVGRTLSRLLKDQGIEPTIIEMNLSTYHGLRDEGVSAFFGDATLRNTLEQAGLASVDTLVLSVGGFQGAEELIRHARDMNPHVRILARTSYLADIPRLREAGADRVFAGEGEVALAMVDSVLRDLGASPEQIDRQRALVHDELF